MQLFVPKGRAASIRHTETSTGADVTSVSEQETPLDEISNQGLRGKDVIDRTKPPGCFFFSKKIMHFPLHLVLMNAECFFEEFFLVPVSLDN